MPGSFLSQRVQQILRGRRAAPISRARMICTTAACGVLATLLSSGMLVRAQSELETGPAFEVASVRPLPGNTYRSDIDIAGNKVNASGPLKHLIGMAYGMRAYQLLNTPDWPELYTIAAKVEGEGAPTKDQARQMLRRLIVERFQLKVHNETRGLPVYHLVVANGSKLKKSAPDAKFDLTFDLWKNRPSRIEGTLAISSLVNQLTSLVSDRPVMDLTGLAGLYDMKLEWTPEAAGPDATGPSLFTALQEQLGLKLEAARDQVQMLVIDHAERPSEN